MAKKKELDNFDIDDFEVPSFPGEWDEVDSIDKKDISPEPKKGFFGGLFGKKIASEEELVPVNIQEKSKIPIPNKNEDSISIKEDVGLNNELEPELTKVQPKMGKISFKDIDKLNRELDAINKEIENIKV